MLIHIVCIFTGPTCLVTDAKGENHRRRVLFWLKMGYDFVNRNLLDCVLVSKIEIILSRKKGVPCVQFTKR